MAGALDRFGDNRRELLWDCGLALPAGKGGQSVMPLFAGGDPAGLADFSPWERMAAEYEVMGLFPSGHLMEFVRPSLGNGVLRSTEVESAVEGEIVMVAGWPIARQHPTGKSDVVFITIEDEVGDVQLLVWPDVFRRRRRELGGQVLLARGRVSRWDGSVTVIVDDVRAVDCKLSLPPSHDWR